MPILHNEIEEKSFEKIHINSENLKKNKKEAHGDWEGKQLDIQKCWKRMHTNQIISASTSSELLWKPILHRHNHRMYL